MENKGKQRITVQGISINVEYSLETKKQVITVQARSIDKSKWDLHRKQGEAKDYCTIIEKMILYSL